VIDFIGDWNIKCPVNNRFSEKSQHSSPLSGGFSELADPVLCGTADLIAVISRNSMSISHGYYQKQFLSAAGH
jgi:hypothetical protein